MQMEPEIQSAFYFDLALRTFFAVKTLQQSGAYPDSMKYISCDEFDGTNSPDWSIDLKTAFINVSEKYETQTINFNFSYICVGKRARNICTI